MNQRNSSPDRTTRQVVSIFFILLGAAGMGLWNKSKKIQAEHDAVIAAAHVSPTPTSGLDSMLPLFSPFSTLLSVASECRVKPDGVLLTTLPGGIKLNVFDRNGEWYLVESTDRCWVQGKNLQGELPGMNARNAPPYSKCVDRRLYSDAVQAAAPPAPIGFGGLELNFGTERNTQPGHPGTYFTKPEFLPIIRHYRRPPNEAVSCAVAVI